MYLGVTSKALQQVLKQVILKQDHKSLSIVNINLHVTGQGRQTQNTIFTDYRQHLFSV